MTRQLTLNERDLTCIVCQELFDLDDHSPLILSCGHTLCSTCIRSGQMRDAETCTTKCPVCRKRHRSPDTTMLDPEIVVENHTMKLILDGLHIKRQKIEEKQLQPKKRLNSKQRMLKDALSDVLKKAVEEKDASKPFMRSPEIAFYMQHWPRAIPYVDAKSNQKVFELIGAIVMTRCNPEPGDHIVRLKVRFKERARCNENYLLMTGRDLVTYTGRPDKQGKKWIVECKATEEDQVAQEAAFARAAKVLGEKIEAYLNPNPAAVPNPEPEPNPVSSSSSSSSSPYSPLVPVSSPHTPHQKLQEDLETVGTLIRSEEEVRQFYRDHWRMALPFIVLRDEQSVSELVYPIFLTFNPPSHGVPAVLIVRPEERAICQQNYQLLTGRDLVPSHQLSNLNRDAWEVADLSISSSPGSLSAAMERAKQLYQAKVAESSVHPAALVPSASVGCRIHRRGEANEARTPEELQSLIAKLQNCGISDPVLVLDAEQGCVRVCLA